MCGDGGGKKVSTADTVLPATEQAQLEYTINNSTNPAEVEAAKRKLLGTGAAGTYQAPKGKIVDTSLAPDLTNKALRDARNAEFARNQAKRGRKSMFLTDSGWSDPMGALTSAGARPTDVKPGY